MNVVIRVDSSTQIGTGHLMRCIALADELQMNGHKVIFICRELIGNIISLISYQVVKLPRDDNFQANDFYLKSLGASQEQDAIETKKVIPKKTNLLIVDSYAIDKIWHRKLRPHVDTLMVIDDLADREFDCDILLNQNLASNKKDYEGRTPANCKFFLGCKFALLRSEFYELREKALEKRKKTKKIQKILISMGGSDLNNFTFEILRQLENNFKLIVVLGAASKHQKMIKDYAKDKNISIIINSNNMSELMFEADLAIGAGGSSAWERCSLGLPTLMYVLSDNQIKVAENLRKLGAVLIVDSLINDLQALVKNMDLWHSISNKSLKVCDGLGVKKIENFLSSLEK